MTQRQTPSTIWFCWLQGLDHAPAIVRQCYASWQRHHPDWQVRFIDRSYSREYCLTHSNIAAEKYDALPPQKQTNILRINLLAREGGIWADATCLCTKPLDEWICEHLTTGFFAFRDPAPDRVLSNWFLAAEPENHLIRSFCNAHNHFWQTYAFPSKGGRRTRYYQRAEHLLSRCCVLPCVRTANAELLLSDVLLRSLKRYPYYVFHYHFQRHLRRDAQARELFESMPYRSAIDGHRLMTAITQGRSIDELRSLLERLDSPVQKLTWKSNAFDNELLRDLFGQDTAVAESINHNQ